LEGPFDHHLFRLQNPKVREVLFKHPLLMYWCAIRDRTSSVGQVGQGIVMCWPGNSHVLARVN